jgi:hypothetical protein
VAAAQCTYSGSDEKNTLATISGIWYAFAKPKMLGPKEIFATLPVISLPPIIVEMVADQVVI